MRNCNITFKLVTRGALVFYRVYVRIFCNDNEYNPPYPTLEYFVPKKATSMTDCKIYLLSAVNIPRRKPDWL